MARLTIFIGTYTTGGSRGIYASLLDTERAVLRPPVLAAETPSPSYLCVDHTGQHIYAASEQTDEGRTSGWVITGASLKPNGSTKASGGGLCHLTVDTRRRLLFAASYSDGTVQTFAVNPDGSPGRLLCTVQHDGRGPVKERQEAAHPHSVWLTPDEQVLCVCDLGMDKLLFYDIQYGSGGLRPRPDWDLVFPPGSGPRHLVFSPNRRYAFVLTELSREVYGLSFHPAKGFCIVERTRLPETNRNASEPPLGAAIRISGDGNYVYASNRGDDSIALIGLDAENRMTDVRRFDAHGAHPRDFILCGEDRYLVCANRNSANIVLFTRSLRDGSLAYAGSIEGIADPVCLLAVKDRGDSA
jgi:6-phosphogluconolactonase